MSLSEKTLNALQTLMAQDIALLTQVQATDDATQAAAIIAAAAAKSGIELSEAELATHFEEAAQTAANQALSDSQLEAVAGGMSDADKMLALTILTLGFGCAIVSINQKETGSSPGFTQKFC